MKKLIYFLTAVLITLTSSATTPSLPASSIDNMRNSGDRYLFIEGGIEFSVYPDGEFDFVLPQLFNNLNINVNTRALNISYNSGFNYDAYVQYDSYGAVVQIVDVPVFYDNWGRIVQAGNIAINYRDGRIARVGNLQVFYNGNSFSYTRGYINPYNRSVSYYPYANYFYRPYVDRCMVYTTPYRRLYTPQRFSYDYHRDHYRSGYRDGYATAYRNFNRPQGSIAHNNARSGSYRDARIATSRSTINTSRRAADVGVSRSSRSIENSRSKGLSPVDRVDRKETANNPSAARSISRSSRSSVNTPSRNSTAAPSRSSRKVNQAVGNTARNTQRTTETTRSRTQKSAPKARQSNQNRQNNNAGATTSRSSRSSSRSSRSGGN